MSKIAPTIVTVALIVSAGIVFLGQSTNNVNDVDAVQDVEIRDGVQYVAIKAWGGYSPRVSTAQAGIPTKLIVTTNGTYDCSASLVIRSIGYQKILPPTGEEIIDLGIPEAGKFQGLCSMGMYSFVINFE